MSAPSVQVPMYGPGRILGAPTSTPSVQVPIYDNNASGPMTFPPRPGMAPPFATGLPSNLPFAVSPPPPPASAPPPLAPGFAPVFGLPGPPPRPVGPPPPVAMPAEPMVMLPDGPPTDKHWFPSHEEPPVAMPMPGTVLADDGWGLPRQDCAPGCPDCPTNSPCGYRWYGGADFMYARVRHQPAPAVLSVGPNGQPGSSVVGDPELSFENQQRFGGRFNLGYWLNGTQTIGVETTFLFLAPRWSNFLGASNGSVVLDRPFFDTTTGTESQVTVAGNGNPGSVNVQSYNFQYGGDLSLRFEFIRRPCWHLDWLVGFKYFVLQEELNIAANSTATNTTTNDRFATTNTHLGGLIGADYEAHLGRFFFDLWGKFSLGQNNQWATISGDTTTNGVTTNGGLLAQPSNIGSHYRGNLDILPEAGINVGFAVSEHLRLRVGYHIIYVNNVIRPGSGIDLNQPTPVFNFHDTTYWAQNFSAGFEFRY
jgi:hypothetical protein